MLKEELNRLLRRLPAVHNLLNTKQGQDLSRKYGHELAAEAASRVVSVLRKRLLKQPERPDVPDISMILHQMEEYIEAVLSPRVKKVINATGIILHTNLGRAVLSPRSQEALMTAGSHFTNLEYDLQKGTRGSRYDHVRQLLVRLTSAEDALVVNNNAAAVLLAVHTLAKGKEVIISRGELVEIGGSFRIPEVLQLGGVTLREVGTTNRTHYHDYATAIDERTGLVLKVHTSNFTIAGFTKAVSRSELSELAHQNGLPLVEDLGSGSILDLASYGLKDETPVSRVLAEGVDVVTFSGDKLLGGSQAGVIVGRKEYIERMRGNQLTRALRIDKLSLAALEATLIEYLCPEEAIKNIPIYKMLTAEPALLYDRAEYIIKGLGSGHIDGVINIVATKAQMGGGSLPGQEIPSWGIAIKINDRPAESIEKLFRSFAIPIIGYIEKEMFILDMRTLLPGDEEYIQQGIRQLLATEVQ